MNIRGRRASKLARSLTTATTRPTDNLGNPELEWEGLEVTTIMSNWSDVALKSIIDVLAVDLLLGQAYQGSL